MTCAAPLRSIDTLETHYRGAHQPLELATKALRESLNYRFLEAGLAYPTYYKGLFPDLRAVLTYAASRARKANLEIWAKDHTNTGLVVEGPE